MMKASTLSLVRGLSALRSGDAAGALEHLGQLDETFGASKPWLENLRADCLAELPSYTEHLASITARPSYRRLLAVTERLLADGHLPQAERTLALAQAHGTDDLRVGELRWLRARLRLAAGRAASAHSDVRWLAVLHPEHPRSNAAMTAIARGEFTALTARELLTRAETAAERGLVDVVDQSVAAALTIPNVRLPEGEQAYLRGVALYRARRFGEAVGPLDSAVAALAARRDRARYLAALATSRSGAGREALERLRAIAQQKPVTENVENAVFLLAREHSLLGNWASASEHYTEFLGRFPSHEFAEAAQRDRLIAWFGEGNYKRFVYWVRQFRLRYPQAKETSLLRSLEALALYRLGHVDQARPIWEDLARAAPLAFVGIAARQRLAELGIDVQGPVKPPLAPPTDVRLPEIVEQLELAGLSEQAESEFRNLEQSWRRAYAPNDSAALCDAYSKLERGRRRFELGRTFASQRGVKDAPQLAPPWIWSCWYPTPHRESVTRHADTHHVAPALIYAVMRQESAFLVDASSPAGAHGLMQIIEPTARRIAADLDRAYDPDHLRVPHHNIEYGAFYLSKLHAHFQHLALVAAAYNAGPEATTRWYAAGRTLPLEAFIAGIPYDETRSYVQRVLENLVAYQTLLGAGAPTIPLDFEAASEETAPVEVLHRIPEGLY